MGEFNLLVVDDSQIYLTMIKHLFREAGLDILCANSGEEALDIIKETPIGLVLTDFNMPGMNGIELAEKVLEMAPDAHIMMITSDPSPEIIAQARRAGITKVTAKPSKLTEILDIINEEKRQLIASFSEVVSTQGKSA